MIVTFIVVFVCSAFLTGLFISSFNPLRMEDKPNERSLHQQPIPRSGGVAIVIAMSLGLLLMPYGVSDTLMWIVGASVLVAFISILDDVKCLSPLLRLAVHFAAAGLVLQSGIALPWGTLGVVVSFFGLIWVMNLYNFMDGMDGFAGGMSVIGFSALSIAALLGSGGEEVHVLAFISALVAVAVSGFLLFNLPPARVFLGDCGSITLGLLAGAFSLWGIRDGLFEWWLPMLVFSTFIVDATVTLIRRGLSGERVWEPHCSHYYQRLVKLGWGHRKTVLAEYVVMLATSLTALILMVFPSELGVLLSLAAWALIFIAICTFIHRMEV